MAAIKRKTAEILSLSFQFVMLKD